jgi:hypothetical protein
MAALPTILLGFMQMDRWPAPVSPSRPDDNMQRSAVEHIERVVGPAP